MAFLSTVIKESWSLLMDSAPYILLGIVMGGLIRMFLSPASVAHHLGAGRFRPVFKAALFGVPLPLCSCGVLPAAASLRKQGANKGAVTSFLIATPESGIDSISISWALLDPIMTVARPMAAFVTAVTAGIAENLLRPPDPEARILADRSCPVDNCCDGIDCHPDEHGKHHSLREKLMAGLRYAFGELWGDLAGWFFVGLLVSGLITAAVPDEFMARFLGGGVSSMLLMLCVGIPIYICATASTPIAATLILKGVSPGAALVFLLAGPATNLTSLSVLVGLLGKRTTVLYLSMLSVMTVLCGLLVDQVYAISGVSAKAMVGQAAELMPEPAHLLSTLVLIAFSVKPLARSVAGRLSRLSGGRLGSTPADGCGCGDSSCGDRPMPRESTTRSRVSTDSGCECTTRSTLPPPSQGGGCGCSSGSGSRKNPHRLALVPFPTPGGGLKTAGRGSCHAADPPPGRQSGGQDH